MPLTKHERKTIIERIERLKTVREIFTAGYNAGCDHLQPPMGPGTQAPRDVNEGYEQWLEEELLRVTRW